MADDSTFADYVQAHPLLAALVVVLFVGALYWFARARGWIAGASAPQGNGDASSAGAADRKNKGDGQGRQEKAAPSDEPSPEEVEQLIAEVEESAPSA
jgi:hypothetical protein